MLVVKLFILSSKLISCVVPLEAMLVLCQMGGEWVFLSGVEKQRLEEEHETCSFAWFPFCVFHSPNILTPAVAAPPVATVKSSLWLSFTLAECISLHPSQRHQASQQVFPLLISGSQAHGALPPSSETPSWEV